MLGLTTAALKAQVVCCTIGEPFTWHGKTEIERASLCCPVEFLVACEITADNLRQQVEFAVSKCQ